MASLNMGNDSFPLTDAEIDRLVTRTEPGNYGLGYLKDDGTFIVKYVGRSDTDLGTRLKDHVGKYKRFKFNYATSPKDAFERECANFHDFGGSDSLDNDIHPARPKYATWKCPSCKIFG